MSYDPVRGTRGQITCAEVVVAGFGVALFAFEFVIILRAGVGDGALAAVEREAW